MSNPILTEEEAAQAAALGQQVNPSTPANDAQNIANQQPGAVVSPQEAAQAQQPQEAVQAVSTLGAPAPPQEPAPAAQTTSIDQTVRGLLIQVIALLHNKDTQSQA